MTLSYNFLNRFRGIIFTSYIKENILTKSLVAEDIKVKFENETKQKIYFGY